jgi:hypothetical protein
MASQIENQQTQTSSLQKQLSIQFIDQPTIFPYAGKKIGTTRIPTASYLLTNNIKIG